ncbi:zinc finger protein [Acrasis kona]|uniref:Zinc finger protein n=1 Tax=Acrasis kona TaxID=1008807 RepID=A0AAW2YYP1_9EUKA
MKAMKVVSSAAGSARLVMNKPSILNPTYKRPVDVIKTTTDRPSIQTPMQQNVQDTSYRSTLSSAADYIRE